MMASCVLSLLTLFCIWIPGILAVVTKLNHLKEKNELLKRNVNSLFALGSENNPAPSCKEILKNDPDAKNGPYHIEVTGVPGKKSSFVYCIMKEYYSHCPNGLTQVMKIDGSMETFRFSSRYWTNKESYEPAAGEKGCDYQETKLPTYWSTPFTQICIRMRVRGRWIRSRSLNIRGDSLYDLIADGQFRGTNLGRSQWKALLPGSSLQPSCIKEGINVRVSTNLRTVTQTAAARIGIIADQSTHCKSPDSYIGFGTAGGSCSTNPNTSCGNVAGCGGDNGDQDIQTHGYIYVY